MANNAESIMCLKIRNAFDLFDKEKKGSIVQEYVIIYFYQEEEGGAWLLLLHCL